MGVEWNVEEAIAGLEALKAKVLSATMDAAERGAQVIVDQAQRNAPKRTGRLAGSISPGSPRQSGTGVTIDIAPRGVVYARIQELGGTITAKDRFLTFRSEGQWHRKRSVTLPPRPYLGPALAESGSDVLRAVRGSWAKAFGG